MKDLKACSALAAAVVVAIALTVSGCAKPPTVAVGTTVVAASAPSDSAAASVPASALASAIDGFGVDLLAKAASGAAGDVVISPLSVDAALSMTANGATGQTASQMRDVLGTSGMSAADVNAEWASLLLQLASRSPSQTLEVANSLWARTGVAFKEPFLDADRGSFGARISVLDFAKDDVAGAINRWVSSSTHGMIPTIVDHVPPSAILYLADAVYFKGEWVSPFAHEATRKEPFTRADGTRTNVEMMHATGSMPYAQNACLRMTKLAYQGGDSAFYVMLPKPGVSMDAALESLKGTGFADLRAAASADTTELALAMPTLDVDYSTELSAPLKALGMPSAFDPTAARFDDMAVIPGVTIYIGRVLHKTKVRVDEKGTEAAAATVVEMEDTAVLAPPPTSIVCDRPYLFSIVDEKSGAMLFLGEVNDPE